MKDIPLWYELTDDYDAYVKKIVGDLTEWYEGNETSIPFTEYMQTKIEKKLAVMAYDGDICLGIIAYSIKYNRITFFAVSHKAENFEEVSRKLIDYALSQLNTKEIISVTVLKSNAEVICKERSIFLSYGFKFNNEELESGVPVDRLCRAGTDN